MVAAGGGLPVVGFTLIADTGVAGELWRLLVDKGALHLHPCFLAVKQCAPAKRPFCIFRAESGSSKAKAYVFVCVFLVGLLGSRSVIQIAALITT